MSAVTIHVSASTSSDNGWSSPDRALTPKEIELKSKEKLEKENSEEGSSGSSSSSSSSHSTPVLTAVHSSVVPPAMKNLTIGDIIQQPPPPEAQGQATRRMPGGMKCEFCIGASACALAIVVIVLVIFSAYSKG